MDKSANTVADLVRCSKRTAIEEEEGEGKPSSRSPSSNLPDDLWVEVFLRLPNCQSAIRCGVVSRQWTSLIYNSQFISSFIRHQQSLKPSTKAKRLSSYTLLFQFPYTIKKRRSDQIRFRMYRIFSEKSKIIHEGRPPSLSSSDNYLNFFPFPIVMRASLNDLLLVGRLPVPTNRYLIGNPLTRQYIALPDAPTVFSSSICGLVCSTDDDTQNRRLRAVQIRRYCYADNKFRATTFCFKTWKWSQSIVTSPRPLIGDMSSIAVVACNGMLHWVEGRNRVQGIIAFDPFEDEDTTEPKRRCLYIDPPGDLNHRFFTSDHICLGTCQGRLRISHLCRGQLDLTLRVWELRDYESNPHSWHLKHKTCFEGNKNPRYRVLAFHPNDAHVIFLQHNNMVYRYNLRRNMKKKVGEFPADVSQKLDSPRFFPLVHPLWPTPVPKLPSVRVP